MEHWFTYFGTELLGSLIFIILGNGVVANVLLKGTKAYKNANFLFIAFGWGFGIGVGVLVATALGGKGHLNPAVTLAYVVNHWEANVGSWGLLPIFLAGQIIGFALGQTIVDLVYSHQIYEYFRRTNHDFKANATKAVLSSHVTVPQSKIVWSSFLMEFVGTAVLIVSILAFAKFNLNGNLLFVSPLLVMLVVLAIACSLSGTTGFAINPFRDLIPRLIYQIVILLPFANQKESANWRYSWIPVFAPLSAGAIIGACFLI